MAALTESYLRKIIKEELKSVLIEVQQQQTTAQNNQSNDGSGADGQNSKVQQLITILERLASAHGISLPSEHKENLIQRLDSFLKSNEYNPTTKDPRTDKKLQMMGIIAQTVNYLNTNSKKINKQIFESNKGDYQIIRKLYADYYKANLDLYNFINTTQKFSPYNLVLAKGNTSALLNDLTFVNLDAPKYGFGRGGSSILPLENGPLGNNFVISVPEVGIMAGPDEYVYMPRIIYAQRGYRKTSSK